MLWGLGRGQSPSVLATGGAFALAAAVIWGWYVPHFAAAHAVPIIDLQLARSPQVTVDLMASYSPAARRDYLLFLVFDCVFPTLGSLFVIAVVRTTLRQFEREQSSLRHALIFPVGAALADLCENGFHAYLTLSYPANAGLLAQAAYVFTFSKYVLLAGNYAVFGLAVVALVAKQLGWVRQSGS